jgi:hypothetical protein
MRELSCFWLVKWVDCAPGAETKMPLRDKAQEEEAIKRRGYGKCDVEFFCGGTYGITKLTKLTGFLDGIN